MLNRSLTKQVVGFLLHITIALFLAAPAMATATLQTLDSTGVVGEYTSLAIDASGKLHISYYDVSNGDLKYATNSSGDWVYTTLDSTGDVGKYTSLAIDASGKLHISYYDRTNVDLKYATNATGSWEFVTVDNTEGAVVGHYSSLGVDSSGNVHISYYDDTNRNLKYAHNIGGGWGVATIEDGSLYSGEYTSLAIDNSDNVYISYYDRSTGALKYAQVASGFSYVTGIIDSIGDVGSHGSLVIDPAGKLHISYADGTTAGNFNLKYATNASGSWVKTTIDTVGHTGLLTSIALDSSGHVHISYHKNSPNPGLMYATNASGGWVTEDLYSTWFVGQYSSIAVDKSKDVHISYYDNYYDVLKYALIAPPAKVPQTGQTTCYDALGAVIACADTGQDGDVLAGVAWPDPRFTVNKDGSDIPDGTITDNLTGLIWVQDASTPTVGACAAGTKTWQGALDYVACLNTENYLGYNDWVLPNVVELKSLVDAGQSSPSLPAVYPFTGVQSVKYWSSSTSATSTGNAWVVLMDDGYVNHNDKSSNGYVWPVRGGQSILPFALPKTGQTASYAAGDDGALQRGVAAPGSRFIDNGDGTVTDHLTGLTWLANANCTDLVASVDKANGYLFWNNALTWSNGLASGSCGLSDNSRAGDWRLPNARELASLVDYAKVTPALPAGHPFTGVQSYYYWSSSTYAYTTNLAWVVSMDIGNVYSNFKSNIFYVWPVRGGVLPAAPPTTTFDVTPSAGSNGSMIPATAQTIDSGLTTSFEITPDAGYSIDSVSGCGGSLVGSIYTTAAVTGDCTVTASFVELDTDGDGTSDNTDLDDDNDGVSDIDEAALGTDPLVVNAFVPQTGQTTCYDAAGAVIACVGTGQDGDMLAGVAWPEPRFTVNKDGSDIPDGTVTDNLTGLVWAQDASTPEFTGGVSTCNAGTKTWQGALDYVACLNDNDYLGFNDWILPNIVEMKSLVDAGQASPALPAGYDSFLTNVQPSFYWSSSTHAEATGYAWGVGLYNGFVGYDVKTYNRYVWPVRGGQSTLALALPKTGQTMSYATGDDGDLERGVAPPATRFVVNKNGSDQDDGTVTDNLTGLTWLADANCIDSVAGVAKGSGSLTWSNALTWSNGLADGSCGLSDGSAAGEWRLPNAREMASFADYSQYVPALPVGYTSFFTGVKATSAYWLSSTSASNKNLAWNVFMAYGSVSDYNKAVNYYVWPVRGGIIPPQDTTPPAAPTQIEVTDLGVGEVLLNWVNPTDADFDHIVIYRSTVSGQLGNVLVTPITNISYVDDTVAANTTYYYTVKAVDASGNESTNTAQLGLTTKNFDIVAPAAPTGLALLAGATAGTVELSWTNPVADFTYVKIFRSTASGELGVQIAVTVGASYQDTQLYNDLVYYYTVKAVDAAGNVSVASAQETITLTTAEVLASGLVAALTVANPTPAPGGTLELSWTNPGDEDYLRIYRSGASGTLGDLVYETFDAGYTDTGLTNNSTYFYTVRTVDSYGNENPDPTQVSALVDDDYAPANVTELSVALQGDGSAMLSWARSASPDAANYNIYWNNGSGDVDYALLSVLTSIGDPETTSWTSAILDVDKEYQFGIRVDDLVNEEQNQDVVVSVNRATTPQPVSARIKTPHTGKPVRGTHETVMAELVKGTPAEVRDVIFQLRTVDRSGPAYGDWVAIDSASVALPGVDASSPYFIHWDTTGLNGEYQLRAVATDTATATSDPYPGFISVAVDNAQAANQEYADGSDLQHKQQAITDNAPNTLVMGDASGVTRVTVPAGGVTVADPLNPPLVKIDVRDPLDVALPALPAGYGDGGVYRDISFDNGQSELNNGRKATIELPYLDAEGDGLIDGATTSVYDLQLCNYHADSWSCLSSTLDAVHKTVRANSGQFSTYALLAPPKLVGNGLTMVTVPLHASPNSTASVLGPVNQYGSYTPVWNPATNSWITRPGTVEPGKSYFIWGNGKAIDVTGTEVSQVDFTISLAPGWNMLGNPFRYEVALDQLQVNCGTTTESLQVAANNGWVVGTFFHYLNGSWQTWSVQDGDNLPTWKGLYMLSDGTCTLTVPPTPAE